MIVEIAPNFVYAVIKFIHLSIAIIKLTPVMKYYSQLTLVLALLGFLSLPLSAQQDELDAYQMEKSIIALTIELAKSWEELDADKYLDYFSPDLDFYIEGERLGFEFLDGIVRNAMSTLKRTTFEVIEPKVSYASHDVAIISFQLKETFLDKNENYEELNAAMTLVWEKKEEQWKITLAHESIRKVKADR